jgi:nitroreductase
MTKKGTWRLFARSSLLKGEKMVDFNEFLKKRRSIRDFEDKGVPLDIVKEIIKDSCLAPSSGHGQPWRFIIINKKGLIKRLSDESKANMLNSIEKNASSSVKQYEAVLRLEDYNVFYNAPCLVYIVGSKEARTLYVDCALAACYFMFSSIQRGLGTCWINLGSDIRNPETLEEIGLPENHRIVAPMIVGYPKIIPNPPERNEPQILKVIS